MNFIVQVLCFIKFIPKYFTLFDVLINRLVFLIFFLKNSFILKDAESLTQMKTENRYMDLFF